MTSVLSHPFGAGIRILSANWAARTRFLPDCSEMILAIAVRIASLQLMDTSSICRFICSSTRTVIKGIV